MCDINVLYEERRDSHTRAPTQLLNKVYELHCCDLKTTLTYFTTWSSLSAVLCFPAAAIHL